MGAFPVSTFECVSPAFLGFLSFALFFPPAHHGCIPSFHLIKLKPLKLCHVLFWIPKLCSMYPTCTCQSSTDFPKLWQLLVKQLLLLHSIRIHSLRSSWQKPLPPGSREVNQIRAVTNQFLAEVYVRSIISAIPVPCLDRKVLVPIHWHWGRSGQCGASAQPLLWMLSLVVQGLEAVHDWLYHL